MTKSKKPVLNQLHQLRKHPYVKLLNTFLQKESVVLLLLVGLAFYLRLRGISSTPTDWHAFRQADTASVTREYVKHGVDLLHPKYQDLSNIASGKDNLDGWRMVEFPFLNAADAYLLRAVPSLDLVTTSRMTTVLFSLGAVVAIYSLGKVWSGKAVGIASAFVFAILPYSVYYSRAILPEIPLVFFCVASILFWQLWLDRRKVLFYMLGIVALMTALLLKPFAAFFLPLYGFLAFQKYGWKVFWKLDFILMGSVFLVLAGIPILWWRHWILQYPSGIPANDWLFNSDHIRFRPAWFRWLFYERLTKLILGWFGMPFFILGLWPKVPAKLRNKTSWNYVVWAGCGLIYLSVIATGNVRHDYYQNLLLPIVSLIVGLGVVRLIEWPIARTTKEFRLAVVVLLLVLMRWGAWQYVGGYYGTRLDWETAGRAADALLPPDAKVIAPAFGDTAFLFQTNRTGWPIGFEIDKKIALGAQYYVTTSYDDEARALEKKYPTVKKTDDYLILKLK